MLAKCFECGKRISTDAERCPSCGYDYRDEDAFGGYTHDYKYIDSETGYIRCPRSEVMKALRAQAQEEKKKEEQRKKEQDESRAVLLVVFLVCAALFWLFLKVKSCF